MKMRDRITREQAMSHVHRMEQRAGQLRADAQQKQNRAGRLEHWARQWEAWALDVSGTVPRPTALYPYDIPTDRP